MTPRALTVAACLFASPLAAQDCTFVRDPVRICPMPEGGMGWMLFGGFGQYTPEAALIRIDGPNAVVVAEPLAQSAAQTLSELEAAAIEGLSGDDGGSDRPASVVLREDTQLLDMPWQTVVYSGQIGSNDVIFANTMRITDTHAIQLITVAHDVTAYSDQHRADHDLFLSLIELEG